MTPPRRPERAPRHHRDLLLLEEPPSIDANEMTDKGSINQRAVLTNRASLVDELYATPLSSRVVAIDGA